MKASIQRSLQSIIIMLAASLLVLSVYFIYEGFTAFKQGSADYIYQLMTGMIGVAMSIYMLTQFTRRLHINRQAPPPEIVTVVECRKCGFKQVKKFTKGDYVLKSVENCQKCNEPMLIAGIYMEEAKKK